MSKDFLLQHTGTLHQCCQIADDIKPFVKQRFKLIFLLRELRHLQVDEHQLVIENLLRGRVHQFHLVVIVPLPFLVETKIQDADGVHPLQLIVPLATRSLFPDGKGRIINAAVLEELLFALLHLHQENLALVVFAIHVEHGTAVILLCTEVFRIQIIDIQYDLTPLQQGVQETDEQILVHFCPEKLLKCKIRVEIDIPVYDTFRSHGYSHLIMSYPTKILNYSHKSIIPSYISATRYRLP